MDNKKTILSENISTKKSNEDYVEELNERLNNFKSLKYKAIFLNQSLNYNEVVKSKRSADEQLEKESKMQNFL